MDINKVTIHHIECSAFSIKCRHKYPIEISFNQVLDFDIEIEPFLQGSYAEFSKEQMDDERFSKLIYGIATRELFHIYLSDELNFKYFLLLAYNNKEESLYDLIYSEQAKEKVLKARSHLPSPQFRPTGYYEQTLIREANSNEQNHFQYKEIPQTTRL